MMPPVSLVQGASRGLGLQFCRSLLLRSPSAQVIATCREPDKAQDLAALQREHGERLSVEKLDVTRPTEVQALAERIKAEGAAKLDLLINCAGILHPSGRGETSLRDVNLEGLSTTLATNAMGPLLMVKHMSPLLAKGSGQYGAKQEGKGHAGVVVNMSARVGSISDNKGLGGWYSYRMSKAALNMATKTLSIELARGRSPVVCVSVHPGTVDTELSRPYHRSVPKGKLFTPEYSADSILTLVDRLSLEDSGKFFGWDGEVIPY